MLSPYNELVYRRSPPQNRIRSGANPPPHARIKKLSPSPRRVKLARASIVAPARHRRNHALKTTPAKLAVKLLQWGILLAIVGYLVRDIYRNKSFAEALERAEAMASASGRAAGDVRRRAADDRPLVLALAGAWICRCRCAMPCGSASSAILLNFVSLGAVGGDLFKAILAARKCHARRAEAVATVIIDRLIGLYIIFVMATVAMLATGVWRAADRPHASDSLPGDIHLHRPRNARHHLADDARLGRRKNPAAVGRPAENRPDLRTADQRDARSIAATRA